MKKVEIIKLQLLFYNWFIRVFFQMKMKSKGALENKMKKETLKKMEMKLKGVFCFNS